MKDFSDRSTEESSAKEPFQPKDWYDAMTYGLTPDNITHGELASGIIGSAKDGVGFGWGDEAQAVIFGGIDYVAGNLARHAVGLPSKSFSESYKEEYKIAKAPREKFAAEYPKSSLGVEMAGSAVTGVGLAKAFPKAFGAAPQGSGFISRVAQTAKSSGAMGAIIGSGKGEGFTDRVVGGVTTALASAVFAPPIAELARAGAAGVSYIANKIKPSLPTLKTNLPTSSKAEKIFVDEVYSRDDLLSKAQEARKVVNEAKRRGIQLTVGEALDDADLLAQQAHLKAGPGAQKAASLRELRQTTQLPKAYEKEVSKISSVGSAEEGGEALVKAARQAQKEFREQLQQKAQPYYEQSSKSLLPKGSKALKNVRVQEYIKAVRKDFPEFDNLPDNHFTVLNQAKILMDGDIGSAASGLNPDRNKVRILTIAKNNLLDKMDKTDSAYAMARKIYSEGAPETEELIAGRIGSIAKKKIVNYPDVPKELLKGDVAQTEKLVKRLPESEVRKGVGGLLRSQEEAVRGENFSTIESRVFGTVGQREKMRTLLGDKYESFAKLMDIFKRVRKGQEYLSGSPTKPLQAAEKAFSERAAEAGQDLMSNKANFALRVMRRITGRTPEVVNAEDALFYDQMADIVLTDKGLGIIEELAKTKPTIEQARRILGNIQTGSAAATAVSASPEKKREQNRSGLPDFNDRAE